MIRSTKVGRVRTCRIEPAVLRNAEQWMAARRAQWEARLDRLETWLRESETPPRKQKGKVQR